MIKGFRHKGPERFFRTGSKAGIQAKHADRLRSILARLQAANGPEDMDLPGLALHPLSGDRKGAWSVEISGNWRVTFEFENGAARNVDYESYH